MKRALYRYFDGFRYYGGYPMTASWIFMVILLTLLLILVGILCLSMIGFLIYEVPILWYAIAFFIILFAVSKWLSDWINHA